MSSHFVFCMRDIRNVSDRRSRSGVKLPDKSAPNPNVMRSNINIRNVVKTTDLGLIEF